MKVEVRGYARDCGTTVLFDVEIGDVKLPVRKAWVRNAGLSMRRTRDKIRINKAPIRMTLNGRYHVSVELTKEEIKSLYFETFAEELSEAMSGFDKVLESRREISDDD